VVTNPRRNEAAMRTQLVSPSLAAARRPRRDACVAKETGAG